MDSTLVRGANATVFITVKAAYSLRGQKPSAGAATSVSLHRKNLRPIALATPTTNRRGVAVARFRVPDIDTGDYELVVRTRSKHGRSETRKPVTVVDGTAIHLRTDRGVYKAGQTIRWRATVVNRADAHPMATSVDVSIRDPRNTAIWRGTKKTDATGMVAGEVPLGEDLILGQYVLEARAGEATAREPVKVREFKLAPFQIKIEPSTDSPLSEGAQLRGRIVARYSHGEPVAGQVRVQIQSGGRSLLREQGKLDRFGRKSFSARVPHSEPIEISAQVTDGAGRTQRATQSLPVRSDNLELTLVPDGRFVAGQKQWLTAITTDGHGNLAPARVFLKVPGIKDRLQRESKGAVRFAITLADMQQINAGAVDNVGRVATAHFYPSRHSGGALVRAERVVIQEGQPIELSGHWESPKGPIIATLLKQGNPAASAAVFVDRDGHYKAQLRAPQGLFGLATVRLAELGWDRATGRLDVTTAHTNVYLEPARLSISLSARKRYKPGQDASLSVIVKDAKGLPAAGVGLAAAVVDERVLALSEPRPDLVEVLRTMDVKSARAAGILFADLLRRKVRAQERMVMRAILARLPADSGKPQVTIAAAERLVAELARVERVRPAIYAYLAKQARPLGKKLGDKWEFRDALPGLMAMLKVKDVHLTTPWNRPTTWSYARELLPQWTFDRVAMRIVNERLDALEARLYKRRKRVHALLHNSPQESLNKLIASRRLEAYLGIDPWGTNIRVSKQVAAVGSNYINLVSAGPDQQFGTKDDLSRLDVFNESSMITKGISGSGYGYGSGGAGFGGRGARAPSIRSGAAEAALSVATRRRFDETVLWVAGVSTDDSGQARLRVPLADSITGWEVAIEAVGKNGAVGATKSRIETFLPLYVDADVPATLTVGDTYELRPVAANHTKSTKHLRVDIKVSGSLRVAGASQQALVLPSGTTTAAHFPIRASQPGSGTVTLTLFDGAKAVDRLERKLTTLPPGLIERRLASHKLVNGLARLVIDVPQSASVASFTGTLRAFRGAADQALEGIEGMLREPYGCFEQTSSTTYPNLLVLDLLSDNPKMAATRSRARKFVGKGYQRLISYEVEGGGFSWFGEKPANQVLTAYGLMEFVDMRKVYPVDAQVIKRTRKWLLSKQQADGSWKPDKSWLHDWNAVQGKVSTTAYIAWALAESGDSGKALNRALRYLRRNRRTLERDPYLLALWAAAESRASTGNSAALRALDRRAAKDRGGLRYAAGKKTLFYASGQGADVQVTALAAMALGQSNRRARAKEALAWLKKARSPNYGWGTTQGTVLALRAATLLREKTPPPSGSVAVRVDGKLAGSANLAAPNVPTIELPGDLRPGRHTVEVSGPADHHLDLDLRWGWRGRGQPRAKAEGIEVSLVKKSEPKGIVVGGLAHMTLKLKNPGKTVVAMPTAVVPLPPGFRLEAAELQTLVAQRRLSKFQDQGSEIQLYLRRLAPGQQVELPITLRAETACDVTQRPAIAYAYYDPQVRGSSASLRLRATRPNRVGGIAPQPPKRKLAGDSRLHASMR